MTENVFTKAKKLLQRRGWTRRPSLLNVRESGKLCVGLAVDYSQDDYSQNQPTDNSKLYKHLFDVAANCKNRHGGGMIGVVNHNDNCLTSEEEALAFLTEAEKRLEASQ